MSEVRLTAWVSGRVQGVGFRWWTRARALELGLSGYAANLESGKVEVRAQGSREACQALLRLLEGAPSQRRPGEVRAVVAEWSPAVAGAYAGFTER